MSQKDIIASHERFTSALNSLGYEALTKFSQITKYLSRTHFQGSDYSMNHHPVTDGWSVGLKSLRSTEFPLILSSVSRWRLRVANLHPGHQDSVGHWASVRIGPGIDVVTASFIYYTSRLFGQIRYSSRVVGPISLILTVSPMDSRVTRSLESNRLT